MVEGGARLARTEVAQWRLSGRVARCRRIMPSAKDGTI